MSGEHVNGAHVTGAGSADAVGERLRLSVGNVAHGGHCVARHEGRAVFVRHALPGEVVVAVVTEGVSKDRFWRADAVEILEPSPDRVPSVWAEAGAGGVGGGELAHVALPAQRDWKLAVLREAFERFAGVEFPGAVHAAPGDDERGGLAYRTRVTAVADADGRATMRLHRSYEARTLQRMPLAVPEVEEALLAARIEPGTRFTVVKPSAGDVVVAPESAQAPAVREAVSSPAGVIEFDVRADGFWQVHREAPSLLTREVADRVGEASSVLDLYAGAGLLGLPLALAGKDVTLVEFDRRATADARRTAERIGVEARVISGDVRRTLKAGALKPAEVVVLDPPRSGAGAATIAALEAVRPRRIVYVACDPVALARDTALLREAGWDLLEAQAFDLFPMTHHVEAIATFERR